MKNSFLRLLWWAVLIAYCVVFECSVAFLLVGFADGSVSMVFCDVNASRVLPADPRCLLAEILLPATLTKSSSSVPDEKWAIGATTSSGINDVLVSLSLSSLVVVRVVCIVITLGNELTGIVRGEVVRGADIVGAQGDGGLISIGSFPGRGTCKGTCGSLMMKESGPDGAVGTMPPEKGVTLVTIRRQSHGPTRERKGTHTGRPPYKLRLS